MVNIAPAFLEVATSSEHIIDGEHGLIYLTDTDYPEIFIAASTVELARHRAAQARIALKGYVTTVPYHTIVEANGIRITVPDRDQLSPEQDIETTLLLQCHLMRCVLDRKD